MFHWDKEDRDYAAFERYFNRGWEDSDSDDYWMSNSNYFMQHSKREKNYLQQELNERSFDEHLTQKDIFFIFAMHLIDVNIQHIWGLLKSRIS